MGERERVLMICSIVKFITTEAFVVGLSKALLETQGQYLREPDDELEPCLRPKNSTYCPASAHPI